MSTKLGNVWMTFRLDVKEAEKDIEATKKKVEAEKQRGGLSAEVPHKKRGTASESGMKMDSKTYQHASLNEQIKEVARFYGGARVSRPADPRFMAAQKARVGAPSELAAAKTTTLGAVGAVAAGYAAISASSKILPEVAALTSEVSGKETPEILERALLDFKVRVDKLETLFTSIKPAFDKTTQFTEAARRITGQMPDSLYYARQNYEVEKERQRLDKKFETWRAKEAPLNTAYTFADMMRRSLTR